MNLIHTGIKELDRIVGGFRYGQLVVIAGVSGIGKTGIANSIAGTAYNEDANIIHFTHHAGFDDLKDASNFSIDPDDEEDDFNYMFVANQVSMPAVTEVVEKVCEGPGLDLLVIDSLFIIEGSKTVEDRNWRIQTLKNMAKEKDFTFVLVTPFLQRYLVYPPTLDDLKEVFYPGIADTVIFLYDTGKRNEIGDKTMKVIVAKNNYGNTGEYEYVVMRVQR